VADNEPGDRQPGQAADDAAWLDLVRRLEETPSGAEPSAPDATASDGPPTPDQASGGQTSDNQASGDGAPDAPPPPAPGHPSFTASGFGTSDGPAAGPRDYQVPDDGDDDEGFIPPEPPALGSGDPAKVLAWCGAVGAPLALLVLTLLWRGAPGLVLLGLAAVFLVAAGYLVFRMPRERTEGDDGARV
jgi:hypothetical protein